MLAPAPPARLISLDVFRGLTVALMLLVNNPGDWGHIYPPLAHADWNGCTLADLVFPFFLFMVGVSTVYGLSGKRATPATRRAALGPVLRRTAVLAGLGLLASTWLDFDLATLRIPGVLVRIALVYGATAAIFLLTAWRTQVALIVGLLVGYALLLQVVPVPGFGPANLAPATNLGAWLDRIVFGEAHLWKESRTWDPEGLLGTLPALGTGLLGLLAGQWLRWPAPAARRTAGLLAAGTAGIAAGLLWHKGFPINKSLWTSSYVLFTGGAAALVLAALHWWCDVRGHRRGAGPWRALGVNALAAFFGSSIVARSLNRAHIGTLSVKDFLYQKGIAPWFTEPRMASLAGAVACLLVWLAVLGWLYRRGWVWKA
ncbi:acyltransferase family protein [Hymenobacter rubidus]|uniref:acyltransferase family protein n=1 Tax=Hymenobacter rubidus TaxID=1441626 RepID=UPI00191D5D0E|nr:heparan-alpha-glucosaminide N-acetyltransferase domain-containing protein [Hymenobacter rubidus]